MLNVSTRDQEVAPARVTDKEFETTGIDFERLVKAGRRQVGMLILFCIVSLIGGALYLAHVVPRYTATAVVLIGSVKDKTGLSASIADLTYDAGAIDSQLEILKSEGLAQTVVTDLKLDASTIPKQPPSFLKGIVDQLKSMFTSSSASTDAALDSSELAAVQRRALIGDLEAGLEVRRVGRSYVINIDYTSPDRIAAADFANAFAQGYINDQLEARFASMKQASGWLEKRITDLKQKSMSSDLAVQRFKSEHGLLTSDGKLVSDQQLTELSTQLIMAQSDRARTEARYAQISSVIEKGDAAGVVAGTLESPVINDLRQKYLSAAQLKAQITDSVGPTHPQVIALQKSMDDYTKLIFGEMTRIATAYKSDAEVARAKEDSLRQSLAKLAGDNSARAQYMVELRELQREADSFRTLYTTFLDRMQQVEEGETSPESEARIITPASPPEAPAYPKRGIIMSLSLVFGLLAGVGVGAVREYKDNTFRTAGDVTKGLGLEFLGMLPSVKVPKPAQASQPERGSGRVDARDPVLQYAVDQPLTSFAETLRAIKVAVDLQLGRSIPKIVGIISVSPDEGKSTVSKNFASLIAHFGLKVLLIDGDLHHPGLTQALAGHAENGLLEVLRGDATLMDTVLREQESGLYFLPAVLKTRLLHANHSLSSPEMKHLLSEAGEQFDYVVVDLPPIGPVVDVRASAALFDAFVFVVRWGRTVRDVVQTTLLNDKEISNRCLGVVYNRVQLDKIKLYEGSDSKAFYHHDFSKYYST